MADIFLSYSRTDKPRVAPLVAALEAQGWSVWWDTALAPGEEFDQVTAAELDRCKAVVVVWTPTSVASRWVRGEARVGAERGVLLPIRFENAVLPIDVRAIQTTDFDDWGGNAGSPAFQKLSQSLALLLGASAAPKPLREAPATRPAGPAICVLPFANMSGDPEQEYFSDGITEDIITDLSKVSALWVAARNTAFAYKGKIVNVPEVARQLNVTHILEGSVRKSGNRVRITAQLIDAGGGHVWAERYDRDLSDIFALQDEISQAIVAALKCKLLPEEKKAIEQRGTANAEAYKFYLMARQYHITADERSREFVVRLCKKALELDPDYAQAWALLALGQSNIRLLNLSPDENGWEAANRALALDPSLAEAHAAKGRIYSDQAQYELALEEIETALRLNLDSYEVNCAAARCYTATHRYEEAIACYERAYTVAESDFWAAGMCIQLYRERRDREGELRTARIALKRAEQRLAAEPDNSTALSFGVTALVSLGETERAKDWMERGLVLNPADNNYLYNTACSLIQLGETDRALDLLDRIFATSQVENLNWFKIDADLDPVREHPRFKAMMATAEARLAKP